MIHRADHFDSFFLLTNDVARDERLSDGAFRLLIFMLSCSDDWSFSLKGLAHQLNLSDGTIARRLSELKKAGYIKQKRAMNSQGQFSSCVWDVYEVPLATLQKNHSVEKLHYGQTTLQKNHSVVEPQCGKVEVIRNTNTKEIPNIRNTKEKKSIEKKRFQIPTVEEVRAYCEERNNSVDPETFVDFYTSKGWKVGKDPMKDWKAAVRTWEKRRKSEPKKSEPFDLEAWAEQEQVKRNGLKTSLEDCE